MKDIHLPDFLFFHRYARTVWPARLHYYAIIIMIGCINLHALSPYHCVQVLLHSSHCLSAGVVHQEEAGAQSIHESELQCPAVVVVAYCAYMLQQQYIELQRRVARPFTKVMLEVANAPVSTTPLPTEQNPSYLGVEACQDDKAAVLSLLVQLPGDHGTGRPSLGRTGVCIGSTLVYVNGSKKPKKKKKANQGQNGVVAGRRGRQRREGQTAAQTEESNSFLVRTGRARLRSTSDSQPSVETV